MALPDEELDKESIPTITLSFEDLHFVLLKLADVLYLYYSKYHWANITTNVIGNWSFAATVMCFLSAVNTGK